MKIFFSRIGSGFLGFVVALMLSSGLYADDFIYNGGGYNANYGQYESSEYKKMMYGDVFQILTLHVGANFGLTQDKVGLDIGASAGWNYFEIEDDEVDFGLRFKYLYTHSKQFYAHSFGLVAYIHPFTYYIYPTMPIIQPVSFVLGAGGISSSTDKHNYVGGGYVEAGVSLFKWFPVNVDITYKASFYGKNNKQNINNIVHSVNLLLNIM